MYIKKGDNGANDRLKNALVGSQEVYKDILLVDPYSGDIDDARVDVLFRVARLSDLDKNILYLYACHRSKAADLLQVSPTYLYRQLKRILKNIGICKNKAI